MQLDEMCDDHGCRRRKGGCPSYCSCDCHPIRQLAFDLNEGIGIQFWEVEG